MATKTIPLAEATATQLAEFATTNYGLDVVPTHGKEKIRAALATAGWTGTEIEVRVADAPPAPAEGNAGADKPRRMVTVLIPNQEKASGGGSEPVWLSVNGRGMWVPREEQVKIPYEYYLVLKSARAKLPITDADRAVTGWREITEYPFSTIHIDPDPEADAAAFRPHAA